MKSLRRLIVSVFSTLISLMRQIICALLGHRSICLNRNRSDQGYYGASESTGWKCERCLTTFEEQWDT